MKKSGRLSAGVLAALILTLLSAGCGKAADSDTASLHLDEDGFLDQQIVERQESSDDFTQEELEAYIEKTIAEYTEQAAQAEASLTGTGDAVQADSAGQDAAEAGDTEEDSREPETEEEPLITLESCSMENGEIRIRLLYRSWKEYAGYNQMPCFAGTVAEARAAGYTFEGNFRDKDGEPAGAEEVLKSPGDRKVLILQEKTEVSVPGTILFSTDNVTVTGKGTAVIGADAAETAEEETVSAVSGSGSASSSEEVSGVTPSRTSGDIAEDFQVLLDSPAYVIYM